MIKKLLNKIIDVALLKRVMGLVKPYKSGFYTAVAIAVALAFLAPLNPIIVQITIDKYILAGNTSMLLNMTLLLIAVLIVSGLLTYFFTYFAAWLGQSIVRDLRQRVYNHLLRLNLRFFDRTPIGTVTTRTINDIEAINDVFAEGVITIISDLLTLIAVLATMFHYSWQITLITLSVLPLLLLAAYFFKEGIRKSFTEVRNQVARLNAFLQEHISGVSVVQVFNSEEREFRKFSAINREHRQANIRGIWYYSVFFPAVEIISATALGLLVWYVAFKASDSSLSEIVSTFFNQDEPTAAGVIAMYIMFLNLLFRPIRMLADKFNTLQMGMVAADRVFKLLDNKDYMSDQGKTEAKKMKGEIKFSHVWFGYDPEHLVLKDVSFQVKAGQTLAIVGATGAGKTSVISVLNRLYEIQKGNISIDNIGISDYTLDSLRQNIGLVLQDVFLFSGSVMDNITLHNPSISEAAVRSAAAHCGVDEWISQLPGGYNYVVGERGGTLSVGQRQLISFVRALVYNPSILILDEATSSIDTESERMIQRAINTLIQDRTSVIIAHRLSTIQHADQILVLDNGEVKESGTHDELIALNGHYHNLYELQFKKKEPELV